MNVYRTKQHKRTRRLLEEFIIVFREARAHALRMEHAPMSQQGYCTGLVYCCSDNFIRV